MMIVRVVGAVKKRKHEVNVNPKCLALLKGTMLMKLLNNFVYMHSTDKYNVQNIPNLKLVLFHLKCKISTKELSVTDFCPEQVTCKHMQRSKFFFVYYFL